MRDSVTQPQQQSAVKTGLSSRSREAPCLCGELFESLEHDKGEVPRRIDTYEFIRELGRGMQAEVYLCRRWPTESESKAGISPRFVAVKVFELHSLRRKSRVRSLLAPRYPTARNEIAEPPNHCGEAQLKMYGSSVTRIPDVSTPESASTTTSNTQFCSLCENKDTELILREIEILKRANHPNMVRLIEVNINRDYDSLIVAMEYEEGSVVMSWDACEEKYISPRTGGLIDPLLAASYAFQLFNVLSYLHSCGIAHGDIKPDNLLLSCDAKTLKICDFGMSIMFDEAPSIGFMEYYMPPGTWCFRAPELCVDDKLLNTVVYNASKTDVWAAAVSLYIFVFGAPPFFSTNPTELFRRIREDKLKFPVQDSDTTILPHFVSFMNDIMTKCPEKRPTAHVASMHPFFNVVKTGDCVTNEYDENLTEGSSLQTAIMTTTDSKGLDVSQLDIMSETCCRGNLFKFLEQLRTAKEAELTQQTDDLRHLGMQTLENDDDGD